MKRYCQTLTLVDDEEMIAKYVEVHQHVWQLMDCIFDS